MVFGLQWQPTEPTTLFPQTSIFALALAGPPFYQLMSDIHKPVSVFPSALPVGSEKDPGHSDTGQATPEGWDGRGLWLQPPGLHRDGRPHAGTDSGQPAAAAQEVRVPAPPPPIPLAPPPPTHHQPPRLTDRHGQTDEYDGRTDTGERRTDPAVDRERCKE